MDVIIAPNAFKNSLSAVEVADAIEEGLSKSQASVRCIKYPMADGGDGTLEVLYTIFGGELFNVYVNDPLGQKIKARWVKSGDKAIIEMAEASGLRLLNEHQYDPLKTNSFGTGQLVIRALDEKVSKIIIGIGGSATVDGGTGILKALGAKFFDKRGDEIKTGNFLIGLHKIDISAIDKRIYDVEIDVLCDVNNPLLGKEGAAYVFGPQKGADKDGVEYLEQSMSIYVQEVEKITHKDYSKLPSTGAAGGVSFMLKSFFNAKFISGAAFILDESGMKEELADADLVITGEGHLDSQSLEGKAPIIVGNFAKKHGKPCIAISGKWENEQQLYEVFTALFTIVKGPVNIEEALMNARSNIADTSMQIGNLWHAASNRSFVG